MKTFNVTLSNNTCLQVIANSMEEVLEAFKAKVTGIVCDNVEEATSPNTHVKWINSNNIKRLEIFFNLVSGCFVARCNKGNIYDLDWFLIQMNYSVEEVIEILSLIEKVTSISRTTLIVKTFNENLLSVRIKDKTLVDSCLLRLMEKVLKELQ